MTTRSLPWTPRSLSCARACALACGLALACGAPATEPGQAGGSAPAEAPPSPAAGDAGEAAASPAGDPAGEAAKRAKRDPRPPPLAKGERRRLDDQPPAEARQRFAAALGRGRKATVKKDYAAAIAAFDEALVALPDHPRALSGRGYARLLAGDLTAAEADLRAALAAASTAELESAIHFNLGLVAEGRGADDEARRRFAIANTLRPSKAAAKKLAESEACPVTIDRERTSELFADYRELWDHLKKDSMAEGPRPADEAAAKAAVCVTVDVLALEGPSSKACVGAEPWLVTREGPHGWVTFAIESADAGQLRLHLVAEDQNARCGQQDAFSRVDGEQTILRHELMVGAVVDVMVGDNDEIVECDYVGECSTACGEDEVEVIDYIFNPWTTSPVAISRPKEAGIEVEVRGQEVRVSGPGCEQMFPLRAP